MPLKRRTPDLGWNQAEPTLRQTRRSGEETFPVPAPCRKLVAVAFARLRDP